MQRGSHAGGASETRTSLVVPLAARAGAALELGAGVSMRVAGALGVAVREGADGLGAPLVGGVELGLGYTP